MQAEQARGVIARFFTSLAMSLVHVETHKVGIVIQYYYRHKLGIL